MTTRMMLYIVLFEKKIYMHYSTVFVLKGLIGSSYFSSSVMK